MRPFARVVLYLYRTELAARGVIKLGRENGLLVKIFNFPSIRRNCVSVLGGVRERPFKLRAA